MQAARALAVILGLAALLQSCPVQAQDQPHRITTTFSYVPLTVDKQSMGSPLVQVKLLDKYHTGTFILDTGTSFNAVTRTMAAKLNLVPKPMIEDGRPSLLAGKPMDEVHLAVLQVGQFPVSGDAVVLKDEDLPAALGTTGKVDGILGVNLLGPLAALFDFSKHEITLWYPGNLTDAEVQQLGFTEPAVPLVQGKTGGVFKALAQAANGTSHGQDAFVIDTGSNHTRLSYALAQQLKLTPIPGSLSPAKTFGDPVGSSTAVLETLKVGQFTFGNRFVDCPAQDKPGQYSPSTLGMDELSRFRVLLDLPAKKMYLQPVAPLSDPATPPAVLAPQTPPPTK